jgi:hypothetical protein
MHVVLTGLGFRCEKELVGLDRIVWLLFIATASNNTIRRGSLPKSPIITLCLGPAAHPDSHYGMKRVVLFVGFFFRNKYYCSCKRKIQLTGSFFLANKLTGSFFVNVKERSS